MNGSRLWIIASVLVGIAIVGLGWLLGIAPLLAQAGTADRQRIDVEAQNAAHEARLAELREQFEHLDEYRDELEVLQQGVPAAPDLDKFLDELDTAAERAEVGISSVAFGEPVAYPTDGAAPAAAAAGTLYTVPVSMELSGEAERITVFADLVQRGTRLFAANGFAFSAAANDASGSLAGHLFVLLPSAPATAAP